MTLAPPVPSGPVGVLGATSRLAMDFARMAGEQGWPLVLYARRPEVVERHLIGVNLSGSVRNLERFGDEPLSSVVNFIGIGDPARALTLGEGIFAATEAVDARVLAWLEDRPEAAYVFLSSGAVHGGDFSRPVSAATPESGSAGPLGPTDAYGRAKREAEARHRARPHLRIIDVRVFNYASRWMDEGARFLLADMVRACRTGEVCRIDRSPTVRDYIGPEDLFQLLARAISAPAGFNGAVDAYTRAPIEKQALAALMRDRYGLRFEVTDAPAGVNATGIKPHYYSLSRSAAALGYASAFSSAETVTRELDALLRS